ncbi:MAG: tetratricopeptide repeat protein [Anaerolineae bacterium]|nr:tetratricopeptide repeat protein [Anaerolineae bacterium]
MLDTLLATKLYIPPAPAKLVERPGLVARINDGLMRRLTLVSAPAGFGKTTLLSEWIALCDIPVAWVSLDEGDNDVVHFLTYLVAALQKIDPGVGEATLTAFQLPQPPALELVLTPLINDLSAIQKPFAIVLDDLHLIEAEPVYRALGFLLDHLPPQAHLVIATRADPPLALSRLRGSGQLVELRATDLRLKPEEAPIFLNQVMGLALSREDIVALETRTEGWLAGLQLAAISMRQSRDNRAFIDAFSGSHEYIIDYLTDEVLGQQSEETRTFLLQTSILDRLSGSLCDAVTGQNNSQQILESLRAANLFLIPLDDERRWYRYHHLMTDLLRTSLQETEPHRIPELHRQASLWYEQNGLMADAIDHALEAPDFGRAASLIDRIAEETLMRSQVATLIDWVEALPDNIARAHSRLSVMTAAAMMLMGHPLEAVENRLKGAADSVEKDAFRAVVNTFSGDFQQGMELSRQALEKLPEDSVFLRSTITWNIATVGMLNGRLEESIRALNEAAGLAQRNGNVIIAVVALSHVAEMTMALGRLREAETIYRQALEMATDSHGRSFPAISFAEAGLGELMRERNDLDAARRLVEEGIRHGKQSGILGLMDSHVTLARILQTHGDIEGANRAIGIAQEIAARFDTTEMDDMMVGLHHVRLLIARGDIDAARRAFDALSRVEQMGGESNKEPFIAGYLNQFEQIGLARLRLAEGASDETLALLETLFDSLETWGWVTALIEALALQALAFQALGDIDRALAALERAFQIAEPEGYARIFLDEGEPMLTLIRLAAGRGIAPTYARMLLGQPAGAVDDRGRLPASTELIEPLSEREMEVLHLVAEGLSNNEISHRLYLALPTIKWHTGNIYGKLGVKSRMQAVARARELGLLNGG